MRLLIPVALLLALPLLAGAATGMGVTCKGNVCTFTDSGAPAAQCEWQGYPYRYIQWGSNSWGPGSGFVAGADCREINSSSCTVTYTGSGNPGFEMLYGYSGGGRGSACVFNINDSRTVTFTGLPAQPVTPVPPQAPVCVCVCPTCAAPAATQAPLSPWIVFAGTVVAFTAFRRITQAIGSGGSFIAGLPEGDPGR